MDLKPFFDLLDKRPFHPFWVELLGGQSVLIKDPDRIVLQPGRPKVRWIFVTYYPEVDDWTFFYPEGIVGFRHADPDGEGGRSPPA